MTPAMIPGVALLPADKIDKVSYYKVGHWARYPHSNLSRPKLVKAVVNLSMTGRIKINPFLRYRV